MAKHTEDELVKLSFADLKSIFDFCSLPSSDYIFYSTIKIKVMNEMQYRLHLIFSDKFTN